MTRQLIFIILLSIAVASCRTTDNNTAGNVAAEARQPVIIYKTKNLRTEYVAVGMNKQKNRIISYPAPSDIRNRLSSLLPDTLAGGFLLDNRGIGPDVAFLDLTYEKYASMPRTPAPEELFGYLMDTEPLVEMYRCPLHKNDENLVDTLNLWITTGRLDQCERLY